MDGLLREMEHWRTFIIVIVLLLRAHKFPDSPSLLCLCLDYIPDQPAVSRGYVSNVSQEQGTGATQTREQVQYWPHPLHKE